MGNSPRFAAAASVASTQLRTITGIAASVGFGASVGRAFALPLAGGLSFGGAWGLILLYAVQLRGIVKGDGSASWSGVFAASVAYVLGVTLAIFGAGKIPVMLDLSTLPLGTIYIAAKFGCHQIGCCNWKHAPHSVLPSLPRLEILFTATFLILAKVVSHRLEIAGAEFCIFSILHVTCWLMLKRFRDN